MTDTDLLQSYIKRTVKSCVQYDDKGNLDCLDGKRLSEHISEIREIVSIAFDIINDSRSFNLVDEDKFRDSFVLKVTNILTCEIIDQFGGDGKK